MARQQENVVPDFPDGSMKVFPEDSTVEMFLREVLHPSIPFYVVTTTASVVFADWRT